MLELIAFILVTIGIANIIVNEEIFSKPRNWVEKVFPYSLLNKLINCTICMGFWVGIGIILIAPQLLPVIGLSLIVKCLLGGAIGSIVNRIWAAIEIWLIN